MQETDITNCKNCGNSFAGKFCSNCGEKVYKEADKSFKHLLEEGVHFTTHFEGKFFTSLKTIFLKPGQFSLDYCNGVRKKYFKPLSFFLFLVILYLLFPFFPGLNMPLKLHYKQVWGTYAEKKVEKLVRENHVNEKEIADKFAVKSEKTSKFLLFIIIPITALIFWLMAFKKRRYYFDHFIYSIEVNSFYIMWTFFVIPLIVTVILLLVKLLNGQLSNSGEKIMGIIVYAVIAAFVAISSWRFYGFKRWYATLFSLVFVISHNFILYYLYKFILFVLVINQIH